MKGRGHECDFKISDITVSRMHCKISASNGTLVVEDCGSKFGTLLKMRNKWQISKETPLVLLCGKILVTVKKNRRWRLFGLCVSGKKNSYLNSKIISFLTFSLYLT